MEEGVRIRFVDEGELDLDKMEEWSNQRLASGLTESWRVDTENREAMPAMGIGAESTCPMVNEPQAR